MAITLSSGSHLFLVLSSAVLITQSARPAEAAPTPKAVDEQIQVGDARSASQRILTDLQDEADPFLAAASCEALLTLGPNDCKTRLAQKARDRQSPLSARLAAAAVLTRNGEVSSAQVFREAMTQLEGRSQLALVEAVRDLPLSHAMPVLARLLESSLTEVRYMAVSAVSQHGVETIRQFQTPLLAMTNDPNPAVRLAATIALARLGQPSNLQKIAEALPRLEGGDLLAAATVLLERGDPRAIEALKKVASGDHETLRLRAAARLGRHDPSLARSVVESGLRSSNPWLRMNALEAVRQLEWPASPTVVLLLSDGNAWVRLRAAEAILSSNRGETH